jgi:hypothetical protein
LVLVLVLFCLGRMCVGCLVCATETPTTPPHTHLGITPARQHPLQARQRRDRQLQLADEVLLRRRRRRRL